MKTLLLKTLLVVVLALLLFVPVGMIGGLVAERQARHQEVVSGIAEGWGRAQSVSGPYVVIPYERRWLELKKEVIDGKPRETRVERSQSDTVFVPAVGVDWTIEADIHEKARGIYKARLYSARLQAQGSVRVPPRSGFEDGRSTYKWGTPLLVLVISDPLGIRAAPGITLNGMKRGFLAGKDDGTGGGLHVPLADEPARAVNIDFDFALELGGSEAFSLAPLGADTTVAMRADWPHPSFQGRYLPAKHEIGDGGFTASWKVSRFATGSKGVEQIAVSFVEPAGIYQQLERASKYGFLFIGLTFAAFMLFELLRRLAIHAVQYALVGLALAMFFLLLTALSEHIDFSLAYAAASVACVGLITAYLVWVLRSLKIAAAFGAALASLYAVLYALLRAEDYSLLGGSLLLFGLLAGVMLATRRVDWYALTGAGLAPAARP